MPSVGVPGLVRQACQAIGAMALALALSCDLAGATSRIKDLANIEGVRQNQLIGYGLVVGLNGTGDTLNNIPFTKQSLQAMLERMGVNIRGATIRTGNVAAVMVTGNLPAFAHPGHTDGRHRLRAGRFQEPAGRHAAGDAAARRRRQRLRGGAGLARDRRFPGRGRCRQDHPRRADGRPDRQRRDHRARDRIRHEPAAQRSGWRCATPISPPRSGSPRRSTISSAPRAPSRSTPPPCSCRSRRNSRATWSPS